MTVSSAAPADTIYPTEPEAYSGVARSLHWLIVALLIAQFAIAWTMPDVHRGTRPIGLIAWHLSVGTSILAVMLVRLLWRWTHPAPPPPAKLSPLLRAVSRLTHYLLYLLLIVLPLLGWANASSRDWPVRLFGFIQLPRLMPAGSHLGHRLGDVHTTLATVLLIVVALHVAGAFYHVLILRDRTVQRMLHG
jgi:cytochrome b561